MHNIDMGITRMCMIYYTLILKDEVLGATFELLRVIPMHGRRQPLENSGT